MTTFNKLLSVAAFLPLAFGLAGCDETKTVTKIDFQCTHLETLDQFDRLVNANQSVLDFIAGKVRSGECSSSEIGTVVRVEKKVWHGDGYSFGCVAPVRGFAPLCQWLSMSSMK